MTVTMRPSAFRLIFPLTLAQQSLFDHYQQQVLLRTLGVFRCVSLTSGCVSSSFENASCVSVLLHFSLHTFSFLCLSLYCYMVLFVCCYMNGWLSECPLQMILLEENVYLFNVHFLLRVSSTRKIRSNEIIQAPFHLA